MLFDLLRQLSEGSEEDPESRLKELHKRRAELDREIAQAELGNVMLLNDAAMKDRFMQFNQQARELLADFREVEHNFRQLDRRVRERIATWDGKKASCWLRLWESGMPSPIPIKGQFPRFWDF